MTGKLRRSKKGAEIKRVEDIFVERWSALVALALAAISGAAIFCGLSPLVDLEKISRIIDTSLKASAVVIGAIWSLNRYFVQRMDQPQLKVEYSIDGYPAQEANEDDVFLLSFRLDILNTSKALLRCEGLKIRLENVFMSDGLVLYETLHEWPSEGFHPVLAIEPSSSAAVSDALPCPIDVAAVNMFLELHLSSGAVWTWHRIHRIKSPVQP